MNWKILFGSFALVFIAELGDKTQLTALAFTTQSRSPWAVFIGTSLALVCASALAVSCGSLLARFVPVHYLHLGSAVMFIAIGVLLLVNMAWKAPEETPSAETVEKGAISSFILQSVIPFEEDLATFTEEQAAREEDAELGELLRKLARAHREHGAHLGELSFGEEDVLPENTEALAERLAADEKEFGKDDPFALVVRRQEAAAEFYIALAGMTKIHSARVILRKLAGEEIRLAEQLCDLTSCPKHENT